MLAAQEAYGTLRSEALGTPLAGVLITVSLARNDSTILRTTTDARGAFRVRTGTEPVIVRALRIGQQPHELGRVTLRAGERRDVGGDLPDRPVRIDAVNTRAEQRCRQDPVNGSLVAQLFSDARTALWASRVAADSANARAVFRQVVQQYDTRDQRVGDPRVVEDTALGLRPFRSNDLDTLLARGFLEVLPDGGMVWSVPDAELLTDDRLLAHYCLQLVPASPDDPTVIGVAFEPARRRRAVVQPRGTLWLDRQTYALRRLEYGYRGVEPAMARTSPGGVVDYLQLDNGVWLVSDWSVRMPRVGNVVLRTRWQPDIEHATVLGTQVTTGYVHTLTMDGEELFTAGNDALRDVERPDVATRARAADTLGCDVGRGDSLATVRGVLVHADGTPLAATLVTARWTTWLAAGEVRLQDRVTVSLPRETVVESGTDGAFVLCFLPRGTAITLQADGDEAPLAQATVRIPRSQDEARVVLRRESPP
jgi:hypothetical protein